eukprot:Clim_evm42s253 gene=Clim_evmTU42s253
MEKTHRSDFQNDRNKVHKVLDRQGKSINLSRISDFLKRLPSYDIEREEVVRTSCEVMHRVQRFGVTIPRDLARQFLVLLAIFSEDTNLVQDHAAEIIESQLRNLPLGARERSDTPGWMFRRMTGPTDTAYKIIGSEGKGVGTDRLIAQLHRVLEEHVKDEQLLRTLVEAFKRRLAHSVAMGAEERRFRTHGQETEDIKLAPSWARKFGMPLSTANLKAVLESGKSKPSRETNELLAIMDQWGSKGARIQRKDFGGLLNGQRSMDAMTEDNVLRASILTGATALTSESICNVWDKYAKNKHVRKLSSVTEHLLANPDHLDAAGPELQLRMQIFCIHRKDYETADTLWRLCNEKTGPLNASEYAIGKYLNYVAGEPLPVKELVGIVKSQHASIKRDIRLLVLRALAQEGIVTSPTDIEDMLKHLPKSTSEDIDNMRPLLQHYDEVGQQQDLTDIVQHIEQACDAKGRTVPNWVYRPILHRAAKADDREMGSLMVESMLDRKLPLNLEMITLMLRCSSDLSQTYRILGVASPMTTRSFGWPQRVLEATNDALLHGMHQEPDTETAVRNLIHEWEHACRVYPLLRRNMWPGCMVALASLQNKDLTIFQSLLERLPLWSRNKEKTPWILTCMPMMCNDAKIRAVSNESGPGPALRLLKGPPSEPIYDGPKDDVYRHVYEWAIKNHPRLQFHTFARRFRLPQPGEPAGDLISGGDEVAVQP